MGRAECMEITNSSAIDGVICAVNTATVGWMINMNTWFKKHAEETGAV